MTLHLTASDPIEDDDDLKPGDHIAVECHYKTELTTYQHHGIIVKGRMSWKVIHFYVDGKVYKDDLSDFSRGIPCVKYKYGPGEALPTRDVIQRAEEYYRKQDYGEFHLYAHNCEHFAMHCKADVDDSLQTHLWPLISKAAQAAVSEEKLQWKHENIYYKLWNADWVWPIFICVFALVAYFLFWYQ